MTEVKKDRTWKDEKPNDVKKRVFRAVNPLTKVNIHTVNKPAQVIDGIKHDAVTIKLKPNKAGQYVLSESAKCYAEQLAVLRARKDIYEVEPSWEGKTFVDPPAPTPEEKRLIATVADKDSEIEKLKKQLEKFTSK